LNKARNGDSASPSSLATNKIGTTKIVDFPADKLNMEENQANMGFDMV